jgi:hypothetical protein
VLVPDTLEAENAPVTVSALVLALYESPASVAGASEPVAEVPSATNVVVSAAASAKVTVDASVARSIVIELGTSASAIEAQVKFPFAAIVVAKVLAPQSVGLAARAVAVDAFPVNAPMKVVAERAPVVASYVRAASVLAARLPVAES